MGPKCSFRSVITCFVGWKLYFKAAVDSWWERVCKRRLNAYGSALTHSASCLTPLLRGPTLFSHFVKQLASKMMEAWPAAQHHDRLAGSPELEPLASDLQA